MNSHPILIAFWLLLGGLLAWLVNWLVGGWYAWLFGLLLGCLVGRNWRCLAVVGGVGGSWR